MPHDSMIIDALDALTQQLVVIDGEGRIVKANAAWRRAHGRPLDEPDADEGRPFLEVYSSDHGLACDVVERMRSGLAAVLEGRQRNFGIEYAHLAPGGGRPRWHVMTAWPVPNGHRGVVVSQQDVTEQRRLEAELAEQAHRDSLTGLPNRRLFRIEGERMIALAERQGLPLTLLYLDLDGFKNVNDTLGHEAGDVVLRRVASRLEAQMRDSDLLARLGGDEFVVLLAGSSENEAAGMMERYRDEVAHGMIVHGRAVALGTSIGVAHHPGDATTVDELLRVADTDMYRDKAGRERARLGMIAPQARPAPPPRSA